MATSHRMATLSNHMKDVGALDLENHGLCVARPDAHFKVLGKFTHEGKTAIQSSQSLPYVSSTSA
jgi:hypothetical protein